MIEIITKKRKKHEGHVKTKKVVILHAHVVSHT